MPQNPKAWNTKEIASILYSRGIIPDASVTNIAQYIKNLEEMELLEAVRIYNSKSYFYRLKSPIMNIYFYLDSRYNIDGAINAEDIIGNLKKSIF